VTDKAERNLIVERDLAMRFARAKTESWRLGNEASEDALTWNVFVGLARLGLLPEALKILTGVGLSQEPQLILWANEFTSNGPRLWPGIQEVRHELEETTTILTEPDVILRIPGKVLAIVEAKFSSRNSTLDKKGYDSPEEFLANYPARCVEDDPLDRERILSMPSTKILEQLCRMAVFGSRLRGRGEDVVVINLLGQQDLLSKGVPEFQSHLRREGPVRFEARCWEDLAPVARAGGNDTLIRYMIEKSLLLAPAFPGLRA